MGRFGRRSSALRAAARTVSGTVQSEAGGRREPLGKTRAALCRVVLHLLIPILVLTVVCEGLVVLTLLRIATALLNFLASN
jgi:hypothetical protein